MRNIHILPTDKPTWLHKSLLSGVLRKSSSCIDDMKQAQGMNISITNDEEIKEGDWFIYKNEIIHRDKGKIDSMWVDAVKNGKKIILTTDGDLIKDGVQAINDEFLEWFVKNPSCEFVEVYQDKKDYGTFQWYSEYKIKIQQEEPKQETLEEAAERLCGIPEKLSGDKYKWSAQDRLLYNFILEGAKWQQEQDKNKFSEEDMRKAIQETITLMRYKATEFREHENTVINQFKNK